MSKKNMTPTLCKLPSGEIAELPYHEATALRKVNRDHAVANNEPTFDGVIICDKCGYTKRYKNNQCYGCKRLKVQSNRHKVAHLPELQSKGAKDAVAELEKVKEELATLRAKCESQAKDIARLNSESEEKNKKISTLEETNRQLGEEMLELL